MGKEQYEVQKIMSKATNPNNTTYYLVKWKGYDQKQSTWQPMTNLTKCIDIIIEFEKEAGKANNHQLQKQIPVPWIHRKKKISKPAGDKTKKQKIRSAFQNKQLRDKNKLSDSNYNYNDSSVKIEEQFRVSRDRQIFESDNQNRQNDSDQQLVLQIKVMKIRKVESQADLQFYIEQDGQKKWIDHWKLLKEYPRELCLFYEANLQLDNGQ